MRKDRINLLGIPVDALTMEETVALVDEAIQSGLHINHVVINAGKVVLMQNDARLFESVISCDLINADGQSIVWLQGALAKKFPRELLVLTLCRS